MQYLPDLDVKETMVTAPFLLCFILNAGLSNTYEVKKKAFHMLRVLSASLAQQCPADAVSVPLTTGDITGMRKDLRDTFSAMWAKDSSRICTDEDIIFDNSWPAQLWVLAQALTCGVPMSWYQPALEKLEDGEFRACQLVAEDIIHQVSIRMDIWARKIAALSMPAPQVHSHASKTALMQADLKAKRKERGKEEKSPSCNKDSKKSAKPTIKDKALKSNLALLSKNRLIDECLKLFLRASQQKQLQLFPEYGIVHDDRDARSAIQKLKADKMQLIFLTKCADQDEIHKIDAEIADLTKKRVLTTNHKLRLKRRGARAYLRELQLKTASKADLCRLIMQEKETHGLNTSPEMKRMGKLVEKLLTVLIMHGQQGLTGYLKTVRHEDLPTLASWLLKEVSRRHFMAAQAPVQSHADKDAQAAIEELKDNREKGEEEKREKVPGLQNIRITEICTLAKLVMKECGSRRLQQEQLQIDRHAQAPMRAIEELQDKRMEDKAEHLGPKLLRMKKDKEEETLSLNTDPKRTVNHMKLSKSQKHQYRLYLQNKARKIHRECLMNGEWSNWEDRARNAIGQDASKTVMNKWVQNELSRLFSRSSPEELLRVCPELFTHQDLAQLLTAKNKRGSEWGLGVKRKRDEAKKAQEDAAEKDKDAHAAGKEPEINKQLEFSQIRQLLHAKKMAKIEGRSTQEKKTKESREKKDKGRTACSKNRKASLKVDGVEDDFLACLMLFRKPHAQEFQLVRLQHKSIESMSPTMLPKGTTSSSSFEEWLVPDDGNCLFAAFAVAHVCCLAFS